MTDFLQHIVDGVSLGAIYALIALGYTMVYGVLQLINFAHGDVFMLGSMIGWYASSRWTQEAAHPSWLGAVGVTILSILVCGTTGFLIERFGYRPLRNSPKLNSLITAIGFSFLLEYGGQVVFGPNPRGFGALPVDPSDQFRVLGVAISYVDVICIGISVLLMVMLQRIIFHSRMGTAMRAVSWNPSVAALMGVNIDRVISFTFVLGSVLAAVAGILYATAYRKVEPLMGLMPGLKAFVAAVLGGIGNVQGAMLGGLILGLAEQLVSSYVSSSWKDAIAFSILILILLVKPSGLLGKGAAEKV
ncbi:MAG TPA: branched-chain amino acid ABC transporter permease [Myxococcales bacterium]|nr:branched-chain amino acid ABC transporter permease [Myxococcales bacterium]